MTAPADSPHEPATRVPDHPQSPDRASGREILAQLLERTPSPPADTDVESLLAAFQTMLAARAAVLAAIAPPFVLSAPDRGLLVELERRQLAWHDALAAAQRTVGAQRCATNQLRAYAAPL
jgi:hypothetical protein